MFKIPEEWDGSLPNGVERDGDYLIAYIWLAADDSDQGVWHSIQALTTGLLVLRKQYPFLHEGSLSSDGATNFKSLLFLLMLPYVCLRANFKLLAHMLPEAGGGKDKCDRDFAGCNQLFDSWISQPGRSMMNANEICQALEAGKTAGVSNCALQIQRDKPNEKAWKDKCDTGTFAKLVGKSKDNLFYMELVWDDAWSNAERRQELDETTAWPVLFKGIRFFAYQGMGAGKFVTATELRTVWRCAAPPILCYEPKLGPSGTKLQDVPNAPHACVKFEPSHDKKQSKKQQRLDQKKAKQAQQTHKAAAQHLAAAERQTSKRCPHCDKPFLCEGYRRVHAAACRGPAVSVQDRKMDAVNSNSFASLRGKLLTDIAALVLSAPKKYMAENKGNVRHAGWATREVSTRPSIRFGDDVVAQLRFCFDQPERWNPHQIRLHLKRHFPPYSSKVLKETQISGWITAEVQRKKKAAVMKAAVVDSAPKGAPPDVVAIFVAENAGEEAMPDMAPHAKTKAPASKKKTPAPKKKPPASPKKKAPAAPKKKTMEPKCDASSSTDSKSDDETDASESSNEESSDDKEHVVEEIINKRYRSHQWEWEVRWLGFPADETTWEPEAHLHSAAEALSKFEAQSSKKTKSTSTMVLHAPTLTLTLTLTLALTLILGSDMFKFSPSPDPDLLS